jgi:hypothetical protein
MATQKRLLLAYMHYTEDERHAGSTLSTSLGGPNDGVHFNSLVLVSNANAERKATCCTSTREDSRDVGSDSVPWRKPEGVV